MNDEASETHPQGGVRVLLVEDHPDVAEMMQAMLEAMDASTEHAATVASAHELMGEHAFDLVLADYRLPDGTGVEVLAAANNDGRRAKVLVLLTGYGDAIEVALPNCRVETKPIDLDRVGELVAEARQAATLPRDP
jgi:CheY-like chemotaxis protein